jgi:hypothetical protein
MNIFARGAELSRFQLGRKILVTLLSSVLSCATLSQSLSARPDAQAATQSGQAPEQAPLYAQQTPDQLQQLVAPIALYPDSLVAQILAASTFPEQVVEADRFLQAHTDLQGQG